MDIKTNIMTKQKTHTKGDNQRKAIELEESRETARSINRQVSEMQKLGSGFHMAAPDPKAIASQNRAGESAWQAEAREVDPDHPCESMEFRDGKSPSGWQDNYSMDNYCCETCDEIDERMSEGSPQEYGDSN